MKNILIFVLILFISNISFAWWYGAHTINFTENWGKTKCDSDWDSDDYPNIDFDPDTSWVQKKGLCSRYKWRLKNR